MIAKTFVAAAVTAAALGSAGVALAGAQGSHSAPTLAAPSTSSSASTTDAGTAVASPAKATTRAGHAGRRAVHKAKRRAPLRHALHATWVTKNGKTGKVVTHDAIRGTASAISATSITVTAADKVAQTYAITSKTHVRVFDATTHKPVQTSISSIRSGQRVRVVGTGTGLLTATNVAVAKKQK